MRTFKGVVGFGQARVLRGVSNVKALLRELQLSRPYGCNKKVRKRPQICLTMCEVGGNVGVCQGHVGAAFRAHIAW